MKTRVYFGIFGFENYNDVTVHMEISPDTAWNYGDGIDINGKNVGKNTARWLIGDLDYTDGDINDKIIKISTRLRDAHWGLLGFPNTWQRKIVIVFQGTNEGFELNRNSILILEGLRSELWIDIYHVE